MVATTPFVLAAASLISLSQATPLEPRAVSYKTYKGDGTVAKGWPTTSDWASFDTMYIDTSLPTLLENQTNLVSSVGMSTSLNPLVLANG